MGILGEVQFSKLRGVRLLAADCRRRSRPDERAALPLSLKMSSSSCVVEILGFQNSFARCHEGTVGCRPVLDSGSLARFHTDAWQGTLRDRAATFVLLVYRLRFRTG